MRRLLRHALGGQADRVTAPSRKFDLARPAATDMPVNPVLLADRLEAIRNAADRFGGTQKKHTSLAQREMEEGQDLPLRLRAQVDEQIAAGDEIEA